jgi:hypothetical protein
MGMLFAGGELGDFTAVGSPTFSTTASYHDSDYSRGSINISSSLYYIIATLSQTSRQNFLSLQNFTNSTYWATTILQARDSDGDIVFDITEYSHNDLQLRVYNSSDTLITSDESVDVGVTASTLNRMTYSADLSASGNISFTYAGASLLSVSGDFSGCNDIASVYIYAPFTSSINTFSEVIISTGDIRNARLKTLDLTANGTTQEWVGDVTDVNAAVTDDAILISSDTASEVATYAASDLSSGSIPIRAVVVSPRATRGTTGPQNLSGVVRVSGTNYGQACNQPPEGLLGATQAFFETNPDTAAAWERSAVNAAEFGVRSDT